MMSLPDILIVCALMCKFSSELDFAKIKLLLPWQKYVVLQMYEQCMCINYLSHVETMQVWNTTCCLV